MNVSELEADWDKNSALAFSNTPTHLLPRNGFFGKKIII
jgi:hypothetical protein